MILNQKFYDEKEVTGFFQDYPTYIPITIQHVSWPVFSGYIVWYKES